MSTYKSPAGGLLEPARRSRSSTAAPPWVVALAWACMGFVVGCAIANFSFDYSAAPETSRSPFEPLQPIEAQPKSTAKRWSSWADIETIFSFGDSYTSSHFNVTQDPQPSKEAPFGNRAGLPADNQNDTYHWIHYLRDRYGASEPVIFNLAKGGATTDPHAFHPPKPGTATADDENSFHGQIAVFNRYNETRVDFRIYWRQPGNVKWDEDRTLFTLWFGIVDLLRGLDSNQALPIDPILSTYMAGLERLYSTGARNFLLINVPPVYRIYRGRHDQPESSRATAEVDTARLNNRILNMRDRFVRRHPDATVFHLDAFELFEKAIADPSSFEQTAGVRNTDRFCDKYRGGADPPAYYEEECMFSIAEYFWLDDVHITPTVHDLIAGAIVSNCFADDGPQFYCS